MVNKEKRKKTNPPMLDLANASRTRGEVLMGSEFESPRAAGRAKGGWPAPLGPKSAKRGEALARLPVGEAASPSGGIMP